MVPKVRFCRKCNSCILSNFKRCPTCGFHNAANNFGIRLQKIIMLWNAAFFFLKDNFTKFHDFIYLKLCFDMINKIYDFADNKKGVKK